MERRLVRIVPPAFRWRQTGEPIFLGNSGTSARLLLALVSSGTGTFVLDGTPRLRQRPIGSAAKALEQLGAGMRWLRGKRFCPRGDKGHRAERRECLCRCFGK